jgi:hypothetical protein
MAPLQTHVCTHFVTSLCGATLQFQPFVFDVSWIGSHFSFFLSFFFCINSCLNIRRLGVQRRVHFSAPTRSSSNSMMLRLEQTTPLLNAQLNPITTPIKKISNTGEWVVGVLVQRQGPSHLLLSSHRQHWKNPATFWQTGIGVGMCEFLIIDSTPLCTRHVTSLLFIASDFNTTMWFGFMMLVCGIFNAPTAASKVCPRGAFCLVFASCVSFDVIHPSGAKETWSVMETIRRSSSSQQWPRISFSQPHHHHHHHPFHLAPLPPRV